MKTEQIIVTCHNGFYECTAISHECGLAVHESLNHPGKWVVTHLKSGRMVYHGAVFDSIEQAYLFLLMIKDMLPWSAQISFDEYDDHSVRIALIETQSEVLIA